MELSFEIVLIECACSVSVWPIAGFCKLILHYRVIRQTNYVNFRLNPITENAWNALIRFVLNNNNNNNNNRNKSNKIL